MGDTRVNMWFAASNYFKNSIFVYTVRRGPYGSVLRYIRHGNYPTSVVVLNARGVLWNCSGCDARCASGCRLRSLEVCCFSSSNLAVFATLSSFPIVPLS